MSDIRSILLVPSDAHREALLGDGPCGARVPVMWRPWREDYGDPVNGGRWDDEWAYRGDGWYDHTDSGEERSMALVLAHDGRVVREGRDRALYVLAEREEFGPVTWITLDAGWDAAFWTLMASAGDAKGYRDDEQGTPPESAWEDGSADFFDIEVTGLYPPRDMLPALWQAWATARICAARGLGTVVLLDAHGREVTRG